MSNLPGLDIEALFTEYYRTQGLSEKDLEKAWESFVVWYLRDLRRRWDRKFRRFLKPKGEK